MVYLGRDGAGFAIAMVVTDPEADRIERASQIIVPPTLPAFNIVRAGPGDGPRRRRRPLRDHL